MHIMLVHIHIKQEYIDVFRDATLENARGSVKEPGVARFDVLQNKEDPTRFTLVEVYRTSDDPARHKETAHYNKWRETVTDMMVEPRQGIICTNLFPDDQGWG